jgi:CheY-like chemotaxis protein
VPIATAPSVSPVGKTAASFPQPKHRILVADDNEDAAVSLAMLLRLQNHEVHTVHDGLAAVDAAAAFQPNLVLLDIGMPKLNGYEAARRIRELPGGEGILVVAVTGWGQQEDRDRSQKAGFDHHLVKPIDPAELAKLIAGRN